MSFIQSMFGFNIASIFGNVVIALCLVFVIGVFLRRRIFSVKGLVVLVGVALIVLGCGALYRYFNEFNGPGFSFYEGNTALQDVVCNLNAVEADIDLKNHECQNDEIRSVKLLKIKGGTVLQVFDNQDGKMEDDWAEIYVKKDIDYRVIPTFTEAIDDDEISLYYSKNNGLDGKLSRVKVALNAAPSSTIAFYEGEKLHENKVCELDLGTPFNPNFKNSAQCDNDEAKSALLRNIPAKTKIRLFDSPDGSLKDDWLDIIILHDIEELIIPSLQPKEDTKDNDYLIQYHHNNGFDGKLSRIELSSGDPEPMAVFYESNNGKGNIVCTVNLNKEINSSFNDLNCSNDEARSVVLYNLSSNKLLKVYDSQEKKNNDDWTEIYVNKSIARKVIDSFESSYKSEEIILHSHPNNGLDGKVSYVELISGKPASQIDLFEGTMGNQSRVCSLPLTEQETNFEHHVCQNDEAKSMILHKVEKGTVIRVFDDPDGNREDDWAEIEVKNDQEFLPINSFKTEVNDQNVRVSYFRNNGLNGKVSRLEVYLKGEATRLISLYEGENGSENKVCDLIPENSGSLKFKENNQCKNDEAKSARLVNLKRGYQFSVYDNSDCKKNDDWALIKINRDINSVIVGSFEESVSNSDFSINSHKKNGLNGKVSCIKFGE